MKQRKRKREKEKREKEREEGLMRGDFGTREGLAAEVYS
jgi:hypothetical protein